MYHEQQDSWHALRNGVKALSDVRVRTIDCGEYSVRVQFNPKRIASSGANVDADSIQARRCFLCRENLPKEQQGVLYRDTFLVLCNPMPIFPQHFTISHVHHIPQSIEGFIPSFLELAKDFSNSHTIFYNGPRCGASAPDHMHFQASPQNAIPVEHDVLDHKRRIFRKKLNKTDLLLIERYGREVLVLEGNSMSDVENGFDRLINGMKIVMQSGNEPMMNILCSFRDGMWRVMFFPRAKHRPSVYFKEGNEKIMISPAAVDIGGLIVTPMEKDFAASDALLVKEIFSEVTVSRSITEKICDNA